MIRAALFSFFGFPFGGLRDYSHRIELWWGTMMLDVFATILALAVPAPVENYNQTMAGWWVRPANSTECRMTMTLPSGIWVSFSEDAKNHQKGFFSMSGKWVVDRQGMMPMEYSFDGWQTTHKTIGHGRNFADGTAMVGMETHWRIWYIVAVNKRVSIRVPASHIEEELPLPDFSWVSANLSHCNATLAK